MSKKNDIDLKIRGGPARIEGIEDYWGEIDLYKNSVHIGEAGFTMSSYQIYIDTITIDDAWQRLGYGKLIMDIFKGLARLLKKPINIYSLTDSYDFYIEMGFKSVNKIKKEGKKKIIVIYKTKDEPIIDDRQMLWLPESLRRKKELRIEL